MERKKVEYYYDGFDKTVVERMIEIAKRKKETAPQECDIILDCLKNILLFCEKYSKSSKVILGNDWFLVLHDHSNDTIELALLCAEDIKEQKLNQILEMYQAFKNIFRDFKDKFFCADITYRIYQIYCSLKDKKIIKSNYDSIEYFYKLPKNLQEAILASYEDFDEFLAYFEQYPELYNSSIPECAMYSVKFSVNDNPVRKRCK